METIKHIQRLRDVLTILDACDPAVDALYSLANGYYDSNRTEYDDLNEAVENARQAITTRLCALESKVLPCGLA